MANRFYKAQEINKLRSDSQCYNLKAPTEWWKMTGSQLTDICNGCGPERWSLEKRKALTSALGRYEATFAIHDLMYDLQDKYTKAEADKTLYANMKKIWAKDFGIWRWFSIGALIERFRVIPFVYAAVALGGGKAHKEARND